MDGNGRRLVSLVANHECLILVEAAVITFKVVGVLVLGGTATTLISIAYDNSVLV